MGGITGACLGGGRGATAGAAGRGSGGGWCKTTSPSYLTSAW